jgi:hypothetical protein
LLLGCVMDGAETVDGGELQQVAGNGLANMSWRSQ